MNRLGDSQDLFKIAEVLQDLTEKGTTSPWFVGAQEAKSRMDVDFFLKRGEHPLVRVNNSELKMCVNWISISFFYRRGPPWILFLFFSF